MHAKVTITLMNCSLFVGDPQEEGEGVAGNHVGDYELEDIVLSGNMNEIDFKFKMELRERLVDRIRELSAAKSKVVRETQEELENLDKLEDKLWDI